ncbi:MAG: transcription termination/antitermination protein NusG [Acidimicrobiia bacterium]
MPDLETAEMETSDVDTELEEAPEAESPEVNAPEAEHDTAETEVPEAEVDATEVDTVEIEPVEAEEPIVEQGVAADEPEVTDASDAEAKEVPPVSASPYDMPGDWYVIHSYSGYENKVKANLETRIQSMHMEDRIFEVHIPMEDMVEFKGGKKQTVSKKVFPGYILVRMTLDDDSWYAVRNTPGVTGFVAGNAQKPTPLSRREVERFLGVQEEEEKAKPRFKPEWEVGEQVRVVTGPFADFNGVIEDMNIDQQKIVVLVNIFGRDTPVELGFEDIQKS